MHAAHICISISRITLQDYDCILSISAFNLQLHEYTHSCSNHIFSQRWLNITLTLNCFEVVDRQVHYFGARGFDDFDPVNKKLYNVAALVPDRDSPLQSFLSCLILPPFTKPVAQNNLQVGYIFHFIRYVYCWKYTSSILTWSQTHAFTLLIQFLILIT